MSYQLQEVEGGSEISCLPLSDDHVTLLVEALELFSALNLDDQENKLVRELLDVFSG